MLTLIFDDARRQFALPTSQRRLLCDQRDDTKADRDPSVGWNPQAGPVCLDPGAVHCRYLDQPGALSRAEDWEGYVTTSGAAGPAMMLWRCATPDPLDDPGS